MSDKDSSKYAWRDEREDGFSHGINPDDYETEEEFDAALDEARHNGK